MRRIGMAVLGLVLAAAPLRGQRSALREVRDGGTAGLTFVVAQPLGEFRRHGNVAVGLTAFGVFGRAVGLRVDGAYMVYDANYLGYGVSTTSAIGTLAVGPQVTVGQGPLRLYGFATLGGSLFWSSASYSGHCGCYDGDDFFLDGHFTTATQLGTGMLITVARRHTPVAIDIGVRDMRHALVTYVPAGGLTDNGDGTFTAEQVQTPVRMRVFQVGVSVGIR
ncbi:MAG TPA: hypothetical protein VGQ25_08520 [Gemmatimonadales bacterium]|jgi:hypothetical protein|nr:hypothetical protein [Gemmatimonadales bacterium]